MRRRKVIIFFPLSLKLTNILMFLALKTHVPLIFFLHLVHTEPEVVVNEMNLILTVTVVDVTTIFMMISNGMRIVKKLTHINQFK